MRFLIDTCAGRRLAEWLRAEGHDVVRVTDFGVDPGDDAVLQRAVDDRRILVTMDKDFGTLIHRDRVPHLGIIRLPHTTVAERIDLVQTILHRFTEADLDGALITVRGTRIRVARRSR